MAQQPCVRCLARSSGLPLSLNLAIRTRNVPSVINGSHSAPFSTTTSLAQPAPKQKIGGGLGGKAGPPKRGDKLTFKIKKKKIVEQKGRPPAPGERKAQRKRIVLSNTNALEVPGMDNYTAETMIQPELLGKVVGVEGEMVDKLRAAEAFRVSQAWGLFRRPGMLIRDVTWKMAQELERMSNKENKDTIRRVIIGELGSGKSVHLLQAMTMAFLKEWVVITIPEAQDLTIGGTEYAPIQGTEPLMYNQKVATAALLSRLARANSTILEKLTISQTHTLPIPLQENISLHRLCLLGVNDPEISLPIFNAVWAELTAPSTTTHPRPKVLLTLDSLNHAMKNSFYMSSTFQPIHAQSMFLLNWFSSYLSGTSTLPNGGFVLAATSESNKPRTRTLELLLSQAETRQILSLPQSERPALPPSPIAPFLEATGQAADPVPALDPYVKHDARVLEVFNGKRAKPVEVLRLKGLSKEEARGLMEYWARSGVMRARVSEQFVGERWVVAGGGVVGELERGCIRMRV